jgi:hypothetical protein
VAGRHRVELAEDGVLDVHPLGDGLDDEVDVAEPVVGRRPVDPGQDLLGLLVGLLLGDLLLLDEPAELTLRDVLGLLEALVDELLLDVLQHHIDAGGGTHLGDLPAHRAGADDGGLEYEHEPSKVAA